MPIGAAVTNKFPIGSAEIRIGKLSEANQLTKSHSVGLLQSASVSVSQESVDLHGGLPQVIIDSVITRMVVKVTAQAYEFSRKNIRLALNEGIDEQEPSEYSGLITSSANTSTSVISTDIALSDVNVDDIVVVYADGAPEKLSSIRVTSVADNGGSADISFSQTKTPLVHDVVAGDKVYKANQLGLGASNQTNYFCLDVIGLEHSSNSPTAFRFWKAAIDGGLDYSFSNDNFAVTPLTFKVLRPSKEDVLPGGALEHIAELVTAHPYGMQLSGPEGENTVAPPSEYENLFDSDGELITDSQGSPIQTLP